MVLNLGRFLSTLSSIQQTPPGVKAVCPVCYSNEFDSHAVGGGDFIFVCGNRGCGFFGDAVNVAAAALHLDDWSAPSAFVSGGRFSGCADIVPGGEEAFRASAWTRQSVEGYLSRCSRSLHKSVAAPPMMGTALNTGAPPQLSQFSKGRRAGAPAKLFPMTRDGLVTAVEGYDSHTAHSEPETVTFGAPGMWPEPFGPQMSQTIIAVATAADALRVWTILESAGIKNPPVVAMRAPVFTTNMAGIMTVILLDDEARRLDPARAGAFISCGRDVRVVKTAVWSNTSAQSNLMRAVTGVGDPLMPWLLTACQADTKAAAQAAAMMPPDCKAGFVMALTGAGLVTASALASKTVRASDGVYPLLAGNSLVCGSSGMRITGPSGTAHISNFTIDVHGVVRSPDGITVLCAARVPECAEAVPFAMPRSGLMCPAEAVNAVNDAVADATGAMGSATAAGTPSRWREAVTALCAGAPCGDAEMLGASKAGSVLFPNVRAVPAEIRDEANVRAVWMPRATAAHYAAVGRGAAHGAWRDLLSAAATSRSAAGLAAGFVHTAACAIWGYAANSKPRHLLYIEEVAGEWLRTAEIMREVLAGDGAVPCVEVANMPATLKSLVGLGSLPYIFALDAAASGFALSNAMSRSKLNIIAVIQSVSAPTSKDWVPSCVVSGDPGEQYECDIDGLRTGFTYFLADVMAAEKLARREMPTAKTPVLTLIPALRAFYGLPKGSVAADVFSWSYERAGGTPCFWRAVSAGGEVDRYITKGEDGVLVRKSVAGVIDGVSADTLQSAFKASGDAVDNGDHWLFTNERWERRLWGPKKQKKEKCA